MTLIRRLHEWHESSPIRMANEQYAFLHLEIMPPRESWQQAIDRAGFDLKLDPEFEPRTSSGYCPCRLNGTETGVEYAAKEI